MTGSAARPQYTHPAAGADQRELSRAAALWWVWLVVGISWVVVALVVLQFDQASITTIGIIVGLMFASAGVQQLALAAYVEEMRWLFAVFGLLFLIAGIICFINPEETFAGLADVLGFLFLTIGVWWIIRAFVEKDVDPIWWLGLVGGALMVVLAFWTSGQFFIEKAYTLLVFAGIWALMQGFTDIVRAFQVRRLREGA